MNSFRSPCPDQPKETEQEWNERLQKLCAIPRLVVTKRPTDAVSCYLARFSGEGVVDLIIPVTRGDIERCFQMKSGKLGKHDEMERNKRCALEPLLMLLETKKPPNPLPPFSQRLEELLLFYKFVYQSLNADPMIQKDTKKEWRESLARCFTAVYASQHLSLQEKELYANMMTGAIE